MKKIVLNNGIKAIIKTNKSTPRTAIVLYARFNKNNINKPGLYSLLASLMFQGTKKRSAEQLAQELNENAIEIYFEIKRDYIRFRILCLNEDISSALEIFQDMFENSTLNNYQKEVQKIKGELESDLDSAKIQAQDEFYRTIYKDHYYSAGRKEIINNIDNITQEELISVYNQIKYVVEKNIFIASDITKEEILPLIEKHFASLKVQDTEYSNNIKMKIDEDIVSTIIKDDANQAQIFMGWLAPSIVSEDFPVMLLINTVLGASGLSSRLFLELREKQGLAYTVRSTYETYRLGSCFFVYIATEPKNIRISVDGFKNEINKIMTELISDEELNNAKNNAIGKRQFYYETNMAEALTCGLYQYWGFDTDYEDKLIEEIKNVKKEDIKRVAQKYLSAHNALTVLAPEEYLKESGLI